MSIGSHRARRALVSAALLACLLGPVAVTAATPQLVVLTETGQARQGRPILAVHPNGASIASKLAHGLPGKMTRLYELEQQYLNRIDGRAIEPAYLLLSNEQGGFPRFGFWLGDLEKRDAGYVDIHRSHSLSGVFGAVDQIFPHELAHVIMVQLAGKAGFGGANQTHALGVRTDPSVAFEEGFAEHLQVLALDDEDALPDTRRLTTDPWFIRKASEHLAAYAREVAARWGPFTPHRMGFLFWFAGAEQSLRYHAVKANAYARMPAIPARLLEEGGAYQAYLLLNVMPGESNGTAKTPAVMLSTEAVVASLFWRWATDRALEGHYREEEFYAKFGTSRAAVTPLENVYLKMFHAFHEGRPLSAQAAIEAYGRSFPDEAGDVARIVDETLLGQAVRPAPGIWLANDEFHVGTTLYDQYRGSPRMHTFDLNAATVVDLISVRGVDYALATRILARAPFRDLAELGAVPGVSPSVMARFESMSREMDRLRTAPSEETSFGRIFRPLIYRALVALLVAGIAGAALFRVITRARIHRAMLNGFAVALVSLAVSWTNITSLWAGSFVFPWLLFGVPAALWQLWRISRQPRAAGPARTALVSPVRVLTGWAAAVLPAVLLVLPAF
jgi:hypothetical protein